MYCGIGNVPKGKVRGTAEHCMGANQVRYYGIEKIDKKLLNQRKDGIQSVAKERYKLSNLIADTKQANRKGFMMLNIINSEKSTEKRKKAAQKKYEYWKKKYFTAMERIPAQREILQKLVI